MNKILFSVKVEHCDIMKENASLRVMIDDKKEQLISFRSSRLVHKDGIRKLSSVQKKISRDFQCSDEVFPTHHYPGVKVGLRFKSEIYSMFISKCKEFSLQLLLQHKLCE